MNSIGYLLILVFWKAPNTLPAFGQAQVPILKEWKGKFPASGLELLPEGQRDLRIGYIGDAKSFEKAWKVYQPKQPVPKVDFKEHIVLFVRNIKFVNDIKDLGVVVNDGRATVNYFETRTSVPITD